MSIKAYLDAIVTTLRTELSLDTNQIAARLTGQPPTNCPQLYYAVHPTNWSSSEQQSNEAIHEQYGISITITQRVSHIPDDRMYASGYMASGGSHEAIRNVMAEMLKQLRPILTAANATITGDDKIVTPLEWQSTDIPPRVVGGEWFNANPNSDRREMGLVTEIRYGRAERHQTADTIE